MFIALPYRAQPLARCEHPYDLRRAAVSFANTRTPPEGNRGGARGGVREPSWRSS